MRGSAAQLEDLRRLVADGHVVVIAGEELSFALSGEDRRARWKGLLLDGVAHCRGVLKSEEDWCDRQRALIERGRVNEVVSVAGHVVDELGGLESGEGRAWLRASLGALSVRDSALALALAGLGCPLATTSPDLLLAAALDLPAVSWDQTAEVERLLRGDARGVLHLHGHWERSESLILGVKERARLEASRHADAVLKALRLTKSLLFVGCGHPPDPNLAAWLRWSGEVFAGSEYRCYRLELDERVDEVQAGHPREQRLFVLGYGRDQADLLRFLQGLKPGGAPATLATPPSADTLALDQLRQLAREAADELPAVFHVPGGPHALSEVAVELVLRAEAEDCGPEALNYKSRMKMQNHLHVGEDLPAGPFPLRRLLELEHRRWVILGEPGSGKTTSLRRFAGLIAEETAAVPVLLRIDEALDVNAALEALIPGAAVAFWAAAARGDAVLLLDGLDEATASASARRAIQSLSTRLGPSLLVVSSRSAAYVGVGGKMRELMLCPLRRDQQEKLLRGWLPEARHAEIPGHLDGLGARMAKLAENPLILTLIARLIRQGTALPRRRVDLYQEVLHQLLTRGHNPDLAEGERPFAGSAAPMRALGWLALHGLGEDADLDFAGIQARVRAAPEDVQEARGHQTVEDWLRRLCVGAGVLEADRTGHRWSFAHRTFREYLAAAALADEVLREGGVKKCGINSELSSRVEEAKAKPALWAEVFALLTGLLAGGEAEALVARLVEGGEDYKPLLYRVLADAEGLSETTVWGVLGLAEGRGAWEERSKVLRGLPELVGALDVAVRLLARFAKAATHGADLFWAHWILSEIAAGRVGDGAAEETRAAAAVEARRVFAEHRAPAREQALKMIEERGWWKRIPAGSFWMGSDEKTDPDRWGSEGPRHRVELKSGFELLAVPVTNALYELFDPDHCRELSTFSGKLPLKGQADVPVYRVNWYEAWSFASWLDHALGGAGSHVRLPNETEWEYACRGGTETRFWSGKEDRDLEAVGWVGKNSGRHPHPVASPPKPRGHEHLWGLHDLHGNVWEWCEDVWVGDYSGRESGVTLDSNDSITINDPAAPRVSRGGGWGYNALNARSGCRGDRLPSNRDVFLGFRLLRVLPE